MKSRLTSLFATLLVVSCSFLSGCAMCCGTYDEAYAGSGGTWQRSDLFHGRVGSPFSDPNARMGQGEVIDDGDLEEIR